VSSESGGTLRIVDCGLWIAGLAIVECRLTVLTHHRAGTISIAQSTKDNFINPQFARVIRSSRVSNERGGTLRIVDCGLWIAGIGD
jgi:hypothetical protein